MDYERSKPNPGDVMCRAHWADLLLLNKIMLGTDLGEKEEEGSFPDLCEGYNVHGAISDLPSDAMGHHYQ